MLDITLFQTPNYIANHVIPLFMQFYVNVYLLDLSNIGDEVKSNFCNNICENLIRSINQTYIFVGDRILLNVKNTETILKLFDYQTLINDVKPIYDFPKEILNLGNSLTYFMNMNSESDSPPLNQITFSSEMTVGITKKLFAPIYLKQYVNSIMDIGYNNFYVFNFSSKTPNGLSKNLKIIKSVENILNNHISISAWQTKKDIFTTKLSNQPIFNDEIIANSPVNDVPEMEIISEQELTNNGKNSFDEFYDMYSQNTFRLNISTEDFKKSACVSKKYQNLLFNFKNYFLTRDKTNILSKIEEYYQNCASNIKKNTINKLFLKDVEVFIDDCIGDLMKTHTFLVNFKFSNFLSTKNEETKRILSEFDLLKNKG